MTAQDTSVLQKMYLSELSASAEVFKLNCHVPSYTQFEDLSHPLGVAAWGCW
jgi:hypothetical protein